MKRDEPYAPSIKSSNPPLGLLFRLATAKDRDAIAALMAERNPDRDLSEVTKGTDKELLRVASEPNYRLYVADLDGEVLGFCRFYHSSGLPREKKIYPSPEGWYAMGIMVHPKYRRQGIARFLSLNRIKALKEMGVKEIYSVVDAKNMTSMRMHREFRFNEISTAPGFLHIRFEAGSGSLFQMLI
jgi:ribosomal protein S18 acetylase RimI-like enzyme